MNTLPEQYLDPTKYKLLESGAVYGLQEGHIVAHLGRGPYTITAESSQQMHQERRERQIRHAQIGDIRGAGIEIASDAPNEEFEDKRLKALETYHEKRGQLVMKATSARGIESVFPAIDKTLMERPEAPALSDFEGMPGNIILLLAQYVSQQKEGAVEGELMDTPKGK